MDVTDVTDVTGTVVTAPRVGWFGDRAVLVRFADADHRAWLGPVLADLLPGHRIRFGVTTALVETATPDAGFLAVVREAVSMLDVIDGDGPGDRVEVPMTTVIRVAYDGPDLDETAATMAVSREGLVRAHTAQQWRVAFVGFAPGFGYLEPVGGSTADWAGVARRASPRRRVPAGSVAVAAGHSAVYPRAMPGGWALIGRTEVELFDPRDPVDPALLHAGDLVRFEHQ